MGYMPDSVAQGLRNRTTKLFGLVISATTNPIWARVVMAIEEKAYELGYDVILAHSLGALTAVRAIMDTRTAQGAIAWAIILLVFPYVSVPAYWIFGRTKFHGYISKRRDELLKTNTVAQISLLESRMRIARISRDPLAAALSRSVKDMVASC